MPAAKPEQTPTNVDTVAPKIDSENSKGELSKSDLNRLAISTTVMILTFKKNKLDGMGSGFSISSNLIATNSHVVEGADSFLVILSDGTRMSAKVIADGVARETGRDLAVLESEKTINVKPIVLSTKYSPLMDVYAYGFPYIAIKDDPILKAVLNGDSRATPNVVASSGVFQRISDNVSNLQVLMHSAKIDSGNSGGALFDSCGRVVGINTYGNFEYVDVLGADGKARGKAQVNAGYYFAISAKEIISFLESRKIPAEVSSISCE
jgi:S1-C subfamily serine protease